jgi:hypothetical protein
MSDPHPTRRQLLRAGAAGAASLLSHEVFRREVNAP